MGKTLPNIFDYTSFRKWLKDYCAARKEENASFSFRSLARKAGFASPNYLQQVIDAKRDLSKESISRITEALCMGKKAARYFELLVHFSQAGNGPEKNFYFSEIIRFKSLSKVTKIIADQFEYYSEWYHCVIRELAVGLPADSMDFVSLARSVYPAILPKQAKKSVSLLLRLGFLVKNEQGRLVQASPFIATDREMQSVAVRNFHDKMLNIARESLENVPPARREISSLTMRISRSGFEKIKTRIQDFKEELMRIIQEDQGVDRVYQANFLFFPVSKQDDE
jgi:uncharacterized protein (TIGR02147 family)